MKSLEFEVKIGLFILIGLVLLTVITFSIGDFLFQPGYYIYLTLGFANGVQVAAPVRLAGIEVGEVKEANVFKDETDTTKVRLKLWLTKEAKVEKDANACVNTLGLIGEKYVEIMPGTPGSPLLADGDTIEGTDSVSVEQMTKKAYEIAVKVEKITDSLDTILTQVKNGKGTIGRLVYDETIYNNIDEMVKDLKANPWKIFYRPAKTKEKTEDKTRKGNKGLF